MLKPREWFDTSIKLSLKTNRNQNLQNIYIKKLTSYLIKRKIEIPHNSDTV